MNPTDTHIYVAETGIIEILKKSKIWNNNLKAIFKAEISINT